MQGDPQFTIRPRDHDPRVGGRWSKRVPVGTAVVLKREEEFVVLQRTGAHGEGTWCVPGGWVNPHEEPAMAAIREAWEEVGVTVHSVKFVGYTFDVHPEGVESVTLWFTSEDWEGRPRPTYPARVLDVRMVTLESMPMPRFTSTENAIFKGFLG